MRALTAALVAGTVWLVAGPSPARTVVDMAGRAVDIPDRVDRVACLEVLCYPRMATIGGADRVVEMVDTAAPWMEWANPAVTAIPRVGDQTNVEDLLARGAQVALFAYHPERTLAQLNAAGIPALVGQPRRQAGDAAEFVAQSKRMVMLAGEVLGGQAQARARDWCAYFDAKLAYVGQRVAAIPAAGRVRLYHVRGPTALRTHGPGAYVYWVGTLAGADMVVKDAGPGLATVAMEDLLRWDPQVVVVGRHYPLGLVSADPRWANVSAVRDGRVVAMPDGVFYWDGGPEQVLLLLFLAKLLYPAHFADLDLTAEVQAYYARFYGVTLRPADAARLLAGQGPDGQRFNPMNN